MNNFDLISRIVYICYMTKLGFYHIFSGKNLKVLSFARVNVWFWEIEKSKAGTMKSIRIIDEKSNSEEWHQNKNKNNSEVGETGTTPSLEKISQTQI